MEEVSLQDIMHAREERGEIQNKLLKEYPETLICMTMNIAGPIKNSECIRKGYEMGKQQLFAMLAAIGCLHDHFEETNDKCGNTAYISVNIDAFALKKVCVQIEEQSAVGRLLDIDVFEKNGWKITRHDVGMKPRKCLLCNNEAYLCSRNRVHSVRELQKKTNSILKNAELQPLTM